MDLKAQIKEQASRASQLSREALEAAKKRDFSQSSKLRQQAQLTGRQCVQLIEQINKNV